MTDKQTYLEELLDEINRVKARGGKGVYRINEKVLDSTVKYVVRYFMNNPAYDIEAKKCAKCKNLWDIIIVFESTPVT